MNFVMCLAAVVGITMWKNPKLFRSFWKGRYDPEQMDEEIKKLGLKITALVLVYLLYLVVRLLTVL